MPLTSEGFQETTNETKESKRQQLKIFSYNLQKHMAHRCSEIGSERSVLSDVQHFLDHDDTCDEQQTSQVYFMALADQNPDSDVTMSLIAEELLDKFGSETQDGWVVLVGDGKTYEHLMNIKRQYGTAVQKLLVFL